MSSSGIRKFKTMQDRTVDLMVNQESNFIGALKVTGTEQTIGAIIGLGEATSGGPGAPVGNFLETGGGTMSGPIAYHPQEVTIDADNNINIGFEQGAYSTYIRVTATGATDDLENIIGAQFSGQDLILQGTDTKTITLKTTGNILPPGGADYVLVDEDIIRAVFDDIQDKWVFWAGAGNIGANKFLSNLDPTTAINSSLVPNAPGTLDLGSDTNYWDQVKTQEIKFLGSVSSPAGTTTEISVDASGDLQFGLIDDIDAYKFYWNGTLGASFVKSGSTIQINADNFSATNQFLIADSTTDPAIDGIFTQNAGDVKVYSGGAVRNFSDIIAGGGANKELSNLNSTSINQSLVPDGTTRDLGSDTNYWDQVKTVEIKFLGSHAAPAGTTTEISIDASGDMQFGLVDALTDFYKFYWNGVLGITMQESSTGVWQINASNINLLNQIILNDSTTDPAINGIFTQNAGDVKVYSGGSVRNFSDLIDDPANDSLSNLTTTSINQGLVPDGPGTRDLGSATNYWDQVRAQEITFFGSVSSPAGTTTEISVDASGDLQFGLIDDIDAYKFYWNGVLGASFVKSGSTIQINADNFSATNQFLIADSTTDPAINGIFTQNAGDVKVYSGGAVRNFSDIAVYANRQLSNLSGTVALNLTIQPDAPASRDLGTDTNYFDQVKVQEVKFLGSVSAPAGTTTEISVDASGDMQFGLVDTTDSYHFYFDGSNRMLISNSQLNLTSNLVLDNALGMTYSNAAFDPAANGEFRLNATDMKVFSGGAVRNLSDIGSGGADTALSNLIATTINQSLVPNTVGTRDLGSDTNYWDQVKVQEVKFLGSVSAPAGTTTEISVDASGDLQFGLVDTTDSYLYYFDGSLRMIVSNSQLNLTGNMVLDNAIGMTFDSAGFDPAADGEFRLNGSDMKVYSGGAVRNFSDIGTGGDMFLGSVQTVTGAKTFLDNILKVRNPANTFSYTFSGSAITANRDLQLPLLLSGDVLMAATTAATVSLKSMSASVNTFTNFGLAEFENQADGGLFTFNTSGSPILLSPGTADQVLTAHGAGAVLTWEDASGGATTLGALDDVVITAVADNEVLAFDTGSGDWINQTPAEASLVDIGGAQTITGFKTFTNAIFTVNSASIFLGDGNTDNITISAKFTQAIIPDTTAIDLGDTTDPFRALVLLDGFNAGKIFFDGGVDTYITGSGATGRMNFITNNDITMHVQNGEVAMLNDCHLRFTEHSTDPTQVANASLIYAKDVSTVTHLFTRDSDGTIHDLSAGGGAQTPWASNIDAANFNLNNLDTLDFNGVGSSIVQVQNITMNDGVGVLNMNQSNVTNVDLMTFLGGTNAITGLDDLVMLDSGSAIDVNDGDIDNCQTLTFSGSTSSIQSIDDMNFFNATSQLSMGNGKIVAVSGLTLQSSSSFIDMSGGDIDDCDQINCSDIVVGDRVRSDSATSEMGFFVKNETAAVGASGTIQIPTVNGSGNPSVSVANTAFGDFPGSMGNYRNTIGNQTRLLIQADNGVWSYWTRTALL